MTVRFQELVQIEVVTGKCLNRFKKLTIKRIVNNGLKPMVKHTAWRRKRGKKFIGWKWY